MCLLSFLFDCKIAHESVCGDNVAAGGGGTAADMGVGAAAAAAAAASSGVMSHTHLLTFTPSVVSFSPHH